MSYYKKTLTGSWFGVAGGVALFFLMAAVGCGSKKKSTAPDYQTGSQTDPNFLLTQSVVNESLVPSVLSSIETALENLAGFSPDTGFFPRPASPRFMRLAPPFGWKHPAILGPKAGKMRIHNQYPTASACAVGYENGWHYAICDTTYTDGGVYVDYHFADSVQFQDGGLPQEVPDENTDGLHAINHRRFTYQEDPYLFGGQGYSNYLFQLSEGGLTLNATEKDSIRAEDAENQARLVFGMTISNIVLAFVVNETGDTTGVCPVSGTFRLMGSIFAEGPEVDVPGNRFSGSFDITITFSDNEARIVVLDTGRRLRWEYSLTGFCNGSV